MITGESTGNAWENHVNPPSFFRENPDQA